MIMFTATRLMTFAGFALLASAERFIFAFGDSYTSTGFNIDHEPPSSKNPIGNPKLPGWTTAHGAGNIASLLALAPVETYVYNLAAMGAPVNNSETQTMAPDFMQQTDILFKQVVYKRSPHCNWTAENTVVTAYFGTNDITATWDKYYKHPDQNPRIITSLFNTFSRHYKHGLRQFVAIGMSPLYRAPIYSAHPVPGLRHRTEIREDVAQWNGLIADGAPAFEKSHPGSVVRVLDLIPVFDRVLDNATEHGAKNNYCFSWEGKGCMWTDDLHPGHAIQHAVGQGIYDTLFSMGFFPQHR